VEAGLPNEKQPQKELKVTDKRLFTSEGELRDEFRDIKPADPAAAAPAPRPAEPTPAQAAPPAPEPQPAPAAAPEPPRDASAADRKPAAERGENPGTPFTMFVESLIVQAYMSLGMIKDPYNPAGRSNPAAARQMIDILTMLHEKTSGNLTPDEEDFLTTHLGELKLAFVQRTKSI
jgi:hypothetical protein